MAINDSGPIKEDSFRILGRSSRLQGAQCALLAITDGKPSFQFQAMSLSSLMLRVYNAS